MNHIYDLLILGGGCAGLSAAIYAARDKLDAILLEKSHPGGQAVNTEEVVNYPGIRHITGPALMREMHLQAMDFGVECRQAETVSVDFSRTVKVVHTTSGTYQGRAVILATGASPRKIGFPGEDTFTGKGISYCANCTSFHGEQIFVLGGGYAAAEEAMFLTRFGKPVTIVVREDDFSCARTIAERVKRHPGVTIWYHTQIKEVSGDSQLRRAVFADTYNGKETVYEAAKNETFGLFIFVGYVPETKIFRNHVAMNEQGYLITNTFLETNVPGVYAAGDLRLKTLRQIVTAVSDGAIAATSAARALETVFPPSRQAGPQ